MPQEQPPSLHYARRRHTNNGFGPILIPAAAKRTRAPRSGTTRRSAKPSPPASPGKRCVCRAIPRSALPRLPVHEGFPETDRSAHGHPDRFCREKPGRSSSSTRSAGSRELLPRHQQEFQREVPHRPSMPSAVWRWCRCLAFLPAQRSAKKRRTVRTALPLVPGFCRKWQRAKQSPLDLLQWIREIARHPAGAAASYRISRYDSSIALSKATNAACAFFRSRKW